VVVVWVFLGVVFFFFFFGVLGVGGLFVRGATLLHSSQETSVRIPLSPKAVSFPPGGEPDRFGVLQLSSPELSLFCVERDDVTFP